SIAEDPSGVGGISELTVDDVPKPGPLLIPAAEAARRLGISLKALNREVRLGRIRYVLIGRRKMYRESDLVRFIEEQSRTCDFLNAKAPRTGSSTSQSVGIGFEAALARTTATSPIRSPAGRGPTNSSGSTSESGHR